MNTADDSDALFLPEDAPSGVPAPVRPTWRILIVDDDDDVHSATTFAFRSTEVFGRPLEFFHARSAQEAAQMLPQLDNLAVILLDVVMEQPDAGLRLVREIRERFGMSDVRIILRTGQPGYAPEIETIRDLDINDYKTKSELSRTKLYAALTAAIRSFDQISKINASRRGLDMIVRGSAELIRLQGLKEFASGIIVQLAALLDLPPEGVVCAQESMAPDGPSYIVLAAAGAYQRYVNEPVDGIACEPLVKSLLFAMQNKANDFSVDHSTFFIPANERGGMAVYLETARDLGEVDLKLIEVFCSNIAVCYENVELFGRLRAQAYHDPMVDLPNRVHFLAEIDRWLAAHSERQRVMAIVDIDSFADINDALGHAYADQLLRAIAYRLRGAFGSSALVARIGGDVFGIFGNESEVKPETIQRLFSAPFRIADEPQTVSATLGLARLAELDGDAAVVFKSASIALKRAQAYQRGHYAYFNRALGEETRDRITLLRNLRLAFEGERLSMHYQPQISLESGAVVGFEALARWRADDGKFVPPDAFIPLAERSGLIVPLGEWILRTACHFQRRLIDAGFGGLRMAVNVSAVQFRHEGFLAMLDRAIAASGIEPTALELEITESVAMLDIDFVAELIRNIKARGVQLALDDFGTGFSSLAYLQRLDADRLKIDRSYTVQVGASPEGRSIARMVVELGKTLGMGVIAEGVEDLVQAAMLREMGCDEAQGYQFARPMDGEAALTWLSAAPMATRFAVEVKP